MGMKYWCVFIGRDGFSREQEMDWDEIKRSYAFRRFNMCNILTEIDQDKVPIPERQPLMHKDHNFILKDKFYALGKNIALYREV